jgi:Carboxypeptidase regulatory-like domain
MNSLYQSIHQFAMLLAGCLFLQINICAQTISGRAQTELGSGIESVTVTLSGPGVLVSTFTNSNGEFSFSGLPDNQSYQLCVELNQDPLNGVSSYDLILLLNHITGAPLLNSPYKIIAGDIGPTLQAPDVLDVLLIRLLILGVFSEFPNSIPAWKFIPADYVFPNPANPYDTAYPPFPLGCKTVNLSVNALNQDFIGIKTGDFNNTAVSHN